MFMQNKIHQSNTKIISLYTATLWYSFWNKVVFGVLVLLISLSSFLLLKIIKFYKNLEYFDHSRRCLETSVSQKSGAHYVIFSNFVNIWLSAWTSKMNIKLNTATFISESNSATFFDRKLDLRTGTALFWIVTHWVVVISLPGITHRSYPGF